MIFRKGRALNDTFDVLSGQALNQYTSLKHIYEILHNLKSANIVNYLTS